MTETVREDHLNDARAKLAVVSCALHALASSAEEDVIISKDAAYGLWLLVAEALAEVGIQA